MSAEYSIYVHATYVYTTTGHYSPTHMFLLQRQHHLLIILLAIMMMLHLVVSSSSTRIRQHIAFMTIRGHHPPFVGRLLSSSSSSSDPSSMPSPSSSLTTPKTREEMVQAKLEKIKRTQAHQQLLMDKMKAKMKRHRQGRRRTEEEKQAMQRQADQSDQWMQDIYNMDDTDEVKVK